MFRPQNDERIANILVFLSSKIKSLSLTKTLKLLYLIDETSIKESGVPVTWLEYKAWRLGPVAEDIYTEIKLKNQPCDCDDEFAISKFITIKREKNPDHGNQEEIFLKSKKKFNDLVFSDYEVTLLERICSKYGNLSSSELIAILHKEGSLWHQEVSKRDLIKMFELLNGRSNHVLDLFSLIIKDKNKTLAFQSAFNSLAFQNQLVDHI
jgi:uncharacterized phage-associated protein